jgi:hypothetical protein
MSEDRKVEDSDPAKYGGLRLSVIKIGLLLLCAGFLLLLILLNAALPWWILLILALPLYLVSQWAGEKVFATKYGWSTERVGFSPKRIAFGVLLVLGVSAVIFLVSRLFN